MQELEGETKPDGSYPAVRAAVKAFGNAATLCNVTEVTSAMDPFGALRWSLRVRLIATAITFIPILAPFIYIARHIVDAEGIGTLCCHVVGG